MALALYLSLHAAACGSRRAPARAHAAAARLPPLQHAAARMRCAGLPATRRRSQLRRGAATCAALSPAGAAVAACVDDDALSQTLFQLAALDPATASSVAGALGPLLSVGTLLFIVRIVMTWYPNIKDDAFPWIIVYAPTEPLLAPTRKLITPVGGVDVSPIVWVALISFANEILLGKQGLLVLLSQKVA